MPEIDTATNNRLPWYVSTAIPYVNARPHIGFALEAVLTDALARYHRLHGDDVFALTGTDDNSLKNVRAAEREGVPTAEFVDRNAAQFQALAGALNLSFGPATSIPGPTAGCIVSAASSSIPRTSW